MVEVIAEALVDYWKKSQFAGKKEVLISQLSGHEDTLADGVGSMYYIHILKRQWMKAEFEVHVEC